MSARRQFTVVQILIVPIVSGQNPWHSILNFALLILIFIPILIRPGGLPNSPRSW